MSTYPNLTVKSENVHNYKHLVKHLRCTWEQVWSRVCMYFCLI